MNNMLCKAVSFEGGSQLRWLLIDEFLPKHVPGVFVLIPSLLQTMGRME